MIRTKPIIAAVAALGIVGLVAACSSSPSTTSGTETIHAVASGSKAAANLNNSNPNAPIVLPVAVYSGPVNLTIKPFTLGSSASGKTATLPGGLRVKHKSAPGFGGNTPPAAKWTLTDGQCYFTTTFDKGTYTVEPGSTGKFAGATGHGTYVLTAAGWAPLSKGKKTCSFSSTGPFRSQGANITFNASGPLTVKS